MDAAGSGRGHAVVVQPGEGPSWWQPLPAGGHADPRLFPEITGFDGMSLGFQTVAPGGRIREHSHGGNVEFLVCISGAGRAIVDGAAHDLRPGTCCFMGYDVRHEVVNDGTDELVMLWAIAPAGLEKFFAAIGRPRTPGEAAPEPFARPADVVATERTMGMNDTTEE